jgi:ATP-dependent RNA helicase DDX54/DBP10
VGTVFSFVDPTEMPYMIDLFLFLGRPLRGLKNEDDEETESRPVNTRVYTLKTMTTEDVDYGIIPRDYIDSANESFLSMKSSHHDLSEQYRVSNNAYVSFYFLSDDCTLNYQNTDTKHT